MEISPFILEMRPIERDQCHRGSQTLVFVVKVDHG